MGLFTRVQYNNKILNMGKEWSKIKGAKEKEFLDHYGNINNSFCLIKGSSMGPKKRPLMLTFPTRPTKSSSKENFEVLEVI